MPRRRSSMGPEPRPDGYEPLVGALTRFIDLSAGIGQPRSPLEMRRLTEERRFLILAAARLDAAHSLVESSRSRLDHWRRVQQGSFLWQDLPVMALADADMAVIALWRVVEMTDVVRQVFGVRIHPNGFVRAKRPVLDQLRSSREHIDERALGLGKGRKLVGVENALADFGAAYRAASREVVLVTGQGALGLGADATAFCCGLRRFLALSWGEMRDIEQAKRLGGAYVFERSRSDLMRAWLDSKRQRVR